MEAGSIVDALLLAAELFDGIAAALGEPSQAEKLEKAWRDLLASQSHDVGLCEYSRWQGDRMAPFDRIEDLHNFTWGPSATTTWTPLNGRVRPSPTPPSSR